MYKLLYICYCLPGFTHTHGYDHLGTRTTRGGECPSNSSRSRQRCKHIPLECCILLLRHWHQEGESSLSLPLSHTLFGRTISCSFNVWHWAPRTLARNSACFSFFKLGVLILSLSCVHSCKRGSLSLLQLQKCTAM